MKENCFWINRKVLVTGATGFIGRWLVNELLSKGAIVFALMRNSDDQILRKKRIDKGTLELIIGQIEDIDLLENVIRSNKIEIIYHLAAKNINISSTLSPFSTLEANIRGSYNLLEAVRLQEKQMPGVILASSQEVEKYDVEKANFRKKRHPYEVSKTCAELIANAYADIFGLKITIVRSENVYGGKDFNWNRLIPGTIRFISKGERPVIRSSGNIRRDYIYIKDVIDAYILAGELITKDKFTNNIIYLGTGESITTLMIVKKICKLMNVNPEDLIIKDQSCDERSHTMITMNETKKMLNWSPQYSIDAGLKITVEWYGKYFSKNHKVLSM